MFKKAYLMCRIFSLSLLVLLTLNIAHAQETPKCEAGFRLYAHPLAVQPVCIPENPERIAFIDNLIAYAIALDVESVTRSYYFDAFLGDFPALVDEETISSMADVGDVWEMNAEALLVANPDVILTSSYWADANEYAQSIAPTVILDIDKAQSWLEIFDAVTQFTGQPEKEAELLAGIDERLTILSDLLGEDAAETTFTVAIIESPEQLWMFTGKNFGAQLALKAGLSLADTVPTPEESAAAGGGLYAMPISLEKLPMIDADHIFMFTNFDSAVQDELFASPIWQNFAGSNPERIHFLAGEYWVRDHPIAAHRVIDDLFRYVAGVEPEEVSPNPFAYTYEVEPEATAEPSN